MAQKMFKKFGMIIVTITLVTISGYSQKSNNEEIEVVKKMFQAFGSGNMDALQQTLADSSVWKYHGSDLIPYAGVYIGKQDVVRFIANIVSNVDILDFKVEQIIANGKTVVVLGAEKQKVKNNGKIIDQKWVQVYTIERGLITQMEEFTNTAYSEKLFK